jgi:tetratricopeptide (TPR) repeat protein
MTARAQTAPDGAAGWRGAARRVAADALCGLALATAAAPAAAVVRPERAELLAIPHPSLDAMEPAVRSQLAQARAAVERLWATEADAASLATVLGELGALYLVYDLGEAAAVCLENAARLAPAEIRWTHLLGTLHEHDRRLEEAAHWFRRAVAIDPAYLPARLRLGKALALAGEAAAARQELAGVAAAAASRGAPSIEAAAEAWMGRLALEQSDAGAAIEHLERALQLQPDASALRYSLARAYRASGEPERALSELRRSGERDVTFSDPIAIEARSAATGVGAQLVLARAALTEGDLGGAEVAMRRAVELDPGSAPAHRYLGEVLARAGRGDEAAAALAEAVRLDPADVEQRLALAAVLERLGRDVEVVDLLTATLALAPSFAPARARLGAALVRLGEHERAEEELARAVELDPEDAGARFLLAQALAAQGRFAEARSQLERVAAQRPELAAARALHARVLLALGREDDAVAELEAAVRLDPGSIESRAMMARALARRGRYAEAAAVQAKVVELDPSSIEARLVLATAQLLAGDVAAARSGLQSALTARPREPRLEDALARVLAGAPSPAVRDGARALELAIGVYDAAPSLDSAETLALALASVGRFEEAAALEQRVVDERRAEGEASALEAERASRWLERYRRREPVLEPWRE